VISVIIPTYNRASFLAEALLSVLGQEGFTGSPPRYEHEIWVIDDGSTDRTREVVGRFGDRVKVCYQEHAGISKARNRGLSLSSGDYIAFLDSDDLWLGNKIRAQLSFMEAYPRAMVCYTEEVWIRNGVYVNPRKKHRKHSGWIFAQSLPLCLLSLSSALFRREVFDMVGMFDESLPACEDYDLGIRVAHRYPVHLLPKPLIVKRGGHPDQLSKRYWGLDRFRIQALEKALELDLSPEQESLVREEIVKKCRVLFQGCRKRKKQKEAEKYLSLIRRYSEEEV